ncbi:hypothetical protein [Andreprevotia sp. IGB-42]|uniref:hypothetical protein n=1 Tax=Andreprevotia sp. IGB-42 TaxID=2497473 RepID=UPI00135CD0EC|nr:hypothetical protein [Andreprevotia sp. IGB-42]
MAAGSVERLGKMTILPCTRHFSHCSANAAAMNPAHVLHIRQRSRHKIGMPAPLRGRTKALIPWRCHVDGTTKMAGSPARGFTHPAADRCNCRPIVCTKLSTITYIQAVNSIACITVFKWCRHCLANEWNAHSFQPAAIANGTSKANANATPMQLPQCTRYI